MIDAGALAELAGAARRAPGPPDLPLLKAVAVPELLAHLDGRLELAEALARAIARTRQYAKRQITWLRHQLPELQPLHGLRRRAQALPGAWPAGAALVDRCALCTHSFRAHPAEGTKTGRPRGGQARLNGRRGIDRGA